MMETASRFRSGKSPEPAHLIARPLGYSDRPALTKSIPAALSRFHRHGIFFRERMAGEISRTENRTTKCLPENERENFNDAVFAFAFFSRRQDRELLGAISRGLLDCPCRL